MAAAAWTTDPDEVTLSSLYDGSFTAVLPLYDGGVKRLTVTVDVTPGRAVRVFVHGEPGAEFAGLESWSDL